MIVVLAVPNGYFELHASLANVKCDLAPIESLSHQQPVGGLQEAVDERNGHSEFLHLMSLPLRTSLTIHEQRKLLDLIWR